MSATSIITQDPIIILFIGGKCVGKSSLLDRLISQFEDNKDKIDDKNKSLLNYLVSIFYSKSEPFPKEQYKHTYTIPNTGSYTISYISICINSSLNLSNLFILVDIESSLLKFISSLIESDIKKISEYKEFYSNVIKNNKEEFIKYINNMDKNEYNIKNLLLFLIENYSLILFIIDSTDRDSLDSCKLWLEIFKNKNKNNFSLSFATSLPSSSMTSTPTNTNNKTYYSPYSSSFSFNLSHYFHTPPLTNRFHYLLFNKIDFFDSKTNLDTFSLNPHEFINIINFSSTFFIHDYFYTVSSNKLIDFNPHRFLYTLTESSSSSALSTLTRNYYLFQEKQKPIEEIVFHFLFHLLNKKHQLSHQYIELPLRFINPN